MFKKNIRKEGSGRALSIAFAMVLLLASLIGMIALVAPSVSAAPAVTILNPAEDQVIYGDYLDLNLSFTDFKLNGNFGGPNVPGEGHWHLFIDDVMKGMYADEGIRITGLLEGDHEIAVELVNNDHTPLDPAVEVSVNITVMYPDIMIMEPVDGAILYGGMIHLNVDVMNFTLTDDYGGENVMGEGHWHLYINDALQGPYSGHWANLTDLPAGQHTFRVDLRNNDHSPISPASEYSIMVTVVEETPELMVKNLPMHAIGYGGMLNIQLGVMNFTLTEDYGMTNMAGEGHVHLYINDGLVGPFSSEWINLTELPAGEHDFRLELRNNDHSMLYPPVHYGFMVTIMEEMPTIMIDGPMDGTILYRDSLDIEVSVTDLMLNASAIGMMPKAGEGHYHIYINDDLVGPYTDLMVKLSDLPAGEHVLKVELVNNDHSPLVPPAMDMVHFTIVDEMPKIMIDGPMDGAMIYDDKIMLEVMVHNFTLNGSMVGMDNVAGEGHYHVSINDDLVGPYTDLSVVLEDLPAGEHELKVELRNNDHSPLVPPAMDMVHFTILEQRPSIMISHPMDMSVIYRDSLDLEVVVENFTLNASAIGMGPVAGEGHYHIYINDVLVGPYINLSVMLSDLPAGEHTLNVMLVNNDHSPIMPYAMDMVHFTIVNETPSISIVKPMDGAFFYGDMLHMEVMIENFMMNASAIGGNNSLGEGHWHLYLNDNLMGPRTEMMVDLTGLPAGTHELKVELRNNDHSPLMPVFMDMVTFTLLETPTITIVSPANGTTIVGDSLDLQVDVSGLMLNASAIGGANKAGEGHYHVYINDVLVGPYTDLSVTLSDLPAGDHVLMVDLRNNDHSELGIDAMDMIYFTIQEEPTEIGIMIGPVLFDGEPLEGAMVEVSYMDQMYSGETDGNGMVSFTVPADWSGMDISFIVTKDGYEDLEGTGTIGANGSVQVAEDLEVEEKEEDDVNLVLILVIVVIIIVVLVALVVLMRPKSTPGSMDEE
jgi:hypothetical protein